jgi:hypothetical protein
MIGYSLHVLMVMIGAVAPAAGPLHAYLSSHFHIYTRIVLSGWLIDIP